MLFAIYSGFLLFVTPEQQILSVFYFTSGSCETLYEMFMKHRLSQLPGNKDHPGVADALFKERSVFFIARRGKNAEAFLNITGS